MELPRERVSSTPSPRHVPRAVAGTGGYRYRSNTWLIGWWHRIKMTVRELVIPFQRNKRSKSVTTAGRPLILTFLRYIEVDSLRASRSARNHQRGGQFHQKIIAGCDYFFDETIFSRVLLLRIHQFFCQKIIPAGDYFFVKLASGLINYHMCIVH